MTSAPRSLQTSPLASGSHADLTRAFEAIDTLLRSAPGFRLFSILAVDLDAGLNRRVYTSDPLNYPVGGNKPLNIHNDFYRQLIALGQPRICSNREECMAAFFDHELIFSLGCESAINFPIRRDGRTLGSLNLLDVQGKYSAASLDDLITPAAMASPILMRSLEQERL